MKELITNLIKAADLEAKLTGEKVDEKLIANLKMWGAGIFRLVVMGEIKKGKSSFINAMLGVEELVPVSSNVATSTIFKIHYGKERGYRVHFLASSGKAPMDINEHDLAGFGTEDGNPGNEKQVDFIEVICPAPLLSSGIVIIDTPGLGGLFKKHKLITYEYVPRADAVFFVTDSVESPIGALEIEYLKDVLKITPNLYFIQTKSSAVDEEACAARKKNNLAILSRELGLSTDEIPYFTLDARLRVSAEKRRDTKRLMRSGYPQLMAYVNDVLQPNQQKLIAARALLHMKPVLAHIQEMLDERRKLLQADSAEKQQLYKQEVETRQKEIRDWQKDTLPGLQRRLKKGLQEIQLAASEKCNKLRPGGEVQLEFEHMMQNAPNVGAIIGIADEINTKLPEYMTQVVQEVAQYIRTNASILLSELAGDSDSSTTTELEKVRTEQNIPMNIRQLRIPEISSTFETLRTSVYGGVAGVTIAQVAGGIIGSVIPIVGTIAGSLIGGLAAAAWGGYQANQIQKTRELETARNMAIGQLSQCFSSIYADLQQILQRVLADVQNKVTEHIEQYVRARQCELENRMKEIQERDMMGTAERKEKEKTLQQDLIAYDGIMREISAWHKMFEPSQSAS